MRNQSFPLRTQLDWKVKAEESLKGKPIESLQTNTYENIILKPLYFCENGKLNSEFPGGSDFRRGIDPLGYISNKWKIAQRISYESTEELIEKLSLAMKRGQTALSFDVSADLFSNNDFCALLNDLIKKFPFAIDGKEEQPAFLKSLEEAGWLDSSKITGYIGMDPLSLFVITGNFPLDFKDWSENVLQNDRTFPSLRTVLINTSTYHNGGANAVQELGIAAATGVFYLQHLLENGMSLEKALSKMIFQFSIGSNFFMEIAKIRAARIIWNKISKVYGAKTASRGMQIAAETSSFTKTLYDKHVNILRSGNEAFAAVVGGVQYLHVTPFDNENRAERLARNTQLILQEEAHLQHVVDPAGGSWYIEELTNELAEKAWGFFQEIDKKNGIVEVLKSNWLQQEISNVFEKRKLDVFTRKESIIGTNVYANLADELVIDRSSIMEHSTIPQTRLAQPYESLRERAGKLKNSPMVGLICLGSLKEHKGRCDFIEGFLAAGGIHCTTSEQILSVDDAKEFVGKQNLKHFCICGSNDQYEKIGLEIVQALKNEFPGQKLFLAGLPEKDEQPKWLENGIKQFLHVKSNCYETLSSILFEMEVC